MKDKSEKSRYLIAACVVLASVSLPCLARAQNQEPAGINLGGTSFFDGFGRNEGGFTLIEYLQWGTSRRFNGERPVLDMNENIVEEGDGSAPSPFVNDPKFDAFLLLNQLIYTLPDPILGDTAFLGIDFLLPVVYFITSFGGPPPGPAVQLEDNGLGIGDLTFGPMLQFRPVMGNGRPVFSNRIELDLVVPIGKYDPDKDFNQSSNFVSFNPYWAGTVLPWPWLELSLRLNYLYNFKNYRPALGSRMYDLEEPPKVKSVQAGQAGWVNFAASMGLFPHLVSVDTGLNIGVNGYYFHQFNLDLWEMQDGSSNPGLLFMDTGKAKFFALGPGIFWKATKHDKFFVNVYFQLIAEHKAQCNIVNLRWVHGFPGGAREEKAEQKAEEKAEEKVEVGGQQPWRIVK